MFKTGIVRFAEPCVTGEDPDFLHRKWDTLSVTYIPEVLSRYNLQAGSMSSKAECTVVTRQMQGGATADVSWLLA